MDNVGLCTIAFKDKNVEEIIDIAAEAGATGLEVWGQPGHVDYPIDEKRLVSLRKRAEGSGISIPVFGSYYRAGRRTEFNDIVVDADNQIAAAGFLGADRIRIWPGFASYEDTPRESREAIYEEIRRFADSAAAAGMTVVLERHGNTLTEGWDAPAVVLDEIAHPAVALNYQAPNQITVEEGKARIEGDYSSLLKRSRHAHIQNFEKSADGEEIRTLIRDGIFDYGEIGAAARNAGYSGFFMIEFPAERRGKMSEIEAVRADVEYLRSL